MELPVKFVDNMKALLGDEYEAYEKCIENKAYHGIRINEAKISVEEFMKINPFSSLKPVPWAPNGFYYDEEVDTPSKHPYYYAGLYYIQEPSAMLPAATLPVEEGDRVLDICAAPGGKSTELLSKLRGTGVLVSNDISASRAKALLKNLETFGAVNPVILSEAPYKLEDYFPEYFDKILIDAPCSGEGMFRKKASIISAWELNGNQTFVDIVTGILNSMVKLLKPGGMLLFSTCTFSPLENEQQIEYLLSLDDRLEIVDFPKADGFDTGHPEWGNTNNSDLVKTARLWPHKINGEGHYTALVKKSGEASDNFFGGIVKSDKISKEAEDFLKEFGFDMNKNHIKNMNGKLFLIPNCFPKVAGLRVLRNGLLLGEDKKNRFEPSQAFAMTLKKGSFSNELNLSIDDDRVKKYLKCETIDGDVKDGYVLVMVDGYPLGWGKANRGTIKNKLLPSWRMM